jgi:hypothetical protein
MSSHTYDYLDGKPAANDLSRWSRCSACDVAAAKGQCALRGTTKRCAEPTNTSGSSHRNVVRSRRCRHLKEHRILSIEIERSKNAVMARISKETVST